MPNVTTTEVFVDGVRNTVVKFEGVLDTADLTTTTVLDPALRYIDPINPTTQYRIDRLDWSCSDPIVLRLQWDATPAVKIIDLSGRGNQYLGKVYGGLQNTATTGKTGKITAVTSGYVSGTVAFTLIMRCVKQ
jgi:hypothetical protein